MSPARMARLESAMRVVMDFNQAFNQHDVTGMMHFLHTDCVFESASPAPDGAVYTGKDAITQFFLDFFATAPQAHRKIEDVFGFGDRCVLRWEYAWHETEEAHQHIRGVDIVRVKDDLICEVLSYAKSSFIPQQF